MILDQAAAMEMVVDYVKMLFVDDIDIVRCSNQLVSNTSQVLGL